MEKVERAVEERHMRESLSQSPFCKLKISVFQSCVLGFPKPGK